MIEPDDNSCEEPHLPPNLDGAADDLVVERAAALLRAMGDTARLRLLERLSGRELCVSEIAEMSNEGMSTVSQRLRTLRSERLVSRRREGKHIYYSLADQHVIQLVQAVLEHAAEEH